MSEAYDVFTASHMADLEVVFRGSSGPTAGRSVNTVVPEGMPDKTTATKALTPAALTARESEDDSTATSNQPAPNTCRILQRKLELKVERARRNFSQHQQQQEQVNKQLKFVVELRFLSGKAKSIFHYIQMFFRYESRNQQISYPLVGCPYQAIRSRNHL